jgi:hypothetical protein
MKLSNQNNGSERNIKTAYRLFTKQTCLMAPLRAATLPQGKTDPIIFGCPFH